MKLHRVLGVATAVLLIAGVAALITTSQRDPEVEGEGRLDPHGRVVLTRDDRPTTVSTARTLVMGDTVEVGDGTAKISLPGGDVLELRTHTIVSLIQGPTLREGSLLVTAAGPPRTVRANGNVVDASGATRMDATLALRVVSYRGRAEVRSGGRTLEVPALREASVPIVGVLRGPGPLAIDGSDDWDRRLLGDAVTRGPDLESLAKGFTAQVSAGNADSVSYYRSLLPGLGGTVPFQQADVDRLGRAASDASQQTGAERFRAGDVLLGAAIALLGGRGTFADRLTGAAKFRGEGAPWGLVALDQQVPSFDALVRLVDGAVNVAPLELALPGAPVTTAPLPTAAPATPPPPTTVAPNLRPAPTTTTTAPARTTPTTLPPARTQPQSPPSLLPPLDPILGAVVDPVVKLLNDLLGTGRR